VSPLLALLCVSVPDWLDDTVAGYAFSLEDGRSTVGVRDPATGYCLVRTTECDGALLSLVLTRDRRRVVEAGYRVPGFAVHGYEGSLPLVARRLRSLRTRKGVAVGDASARVRRRLGPPTRTESSGQGRLDYVYRGRAADGAEHTQTYSFAAGRLVEIAFFRDATGE
jgi:hypothetical protein